MKKIQFLKVAATAILVAGLLFLIKGCKKTENNGLTPKQQDEFAAIIKKTYGGPVSASFVTPINKTADEVFYKNSTGKMENIFGGGAAKPPQGCQYSCFNTNNPANLGYISYTLDYAERYYICESSLPPGSQSNVRVKWTVVLPTVPEIVAGTNNVQNTFCNVKFTNTGTGAVQTFVIPASQMQGKALGQMFNCPNAFLFEITGFVTQVPNQYFQSGWVVSAQVSLDIFCPVLGGVTQSSYVDGPAFSQNSYLPCNRIDKVWTYDGIKTALGNRLGINCTPPSGFLNIDNHQLEYRQVTSSTSLKWEDQSDIPKWGIPFNMNAQFPTFGPLDYISMPDISTGLWLIRYRNVKNGSCDVINPNAPNGNWGNDALWVTDIRIF